MLLALLAACGGSRLFGDRPSVAPSVAPQQMIAGEPAPTGEDYKDYGKNPWIDASKDHLSTFAADVDTASYAIARRKLQSGELPPTASVRVEEWVNYFKYGFPAAPAETTP